MAGRQLKNDLAEETGVELMEREHSRPRLSGAWFLALLAGSAFLAGTTGSLAALQSEDAREMAELVGHVANASTGGPVEGAFVSLLGSGYGALTDAEGNFRIPQTPAGIDSVQVRFIGYEPSHTVIELVPNETTQVTLLLSQTAVRVAELVVELRRSRRERNLTGFAERMEKGFGTFFTPRDILNRNPRLPSDLLRGEPGVTVRRIQFGRAEVYLGRGEALRCPPALYLDGMYQPGSQFDDLPKEDLGAVEIYKRDLETPVEFMRAGSTCGAIVVWTPGGDDFYEWAEEVSQPFE